MKTFLAAVICFFAMLASLFLYINYMDKATEGLLSALEKVEKGVKAENWEESSCELESFQNEWEKKRKKFGIFIDQKDTESVNENISVLKTYIDNKNPDEAQVKISTIKLQLEQMSKKEKPTLVNILMYGSKTEEKSYYNIGRLKSRLYKNRHKTAVTEELPAAVLCPIL